MGKSVCNIVVSAPRAARRTAGRRRDAAGAVAGDRRGRVGILQRVGQLEVGPADARSGPAVGVLPVVIEGLGSGRQGAGGGVGGWYNAMMHGQADCSYLVTYFLCAFSLPPLCLPLPL